MRQKSFERLWAGLDRDEDILDERGVRVAARLMKWARQPTDFDSSQQTIKADSLKD